MASRSTLVMARNFHLKDVYRLLATGLRVIIIDDKKYLIDDYN